MSKLSNGLKLIGKGAFSMAYAYSDSQVLIKSLDHAKECLALWCNNERLPKLERLSYGYYVAERYSKVKSLKNSLLTDEYNFYKLLKKIGSCAGYQEIYKTFEQLPDHEIKTALLEFIYCFADYCDETMRFEISPRNVAVKDKKLILLDCFFDRRQLIDSDYKRELNSI